MTTASIQGFPKPSEIMKKRRPYLYSDSSKIGAYNLSRSEFTNWLNTLTDRNQHNDFEVFCRHLCQRVICPNLRTQTGPEGGGDGKVDTETYPVSTEVSDRWYAGDANAGEERWGFAISTKEDWLSKIKSDVKGMVGTGRKYDRIYFLTSRAVKAKKCHDIQDKLTDEYNIPIIVLDREWIIDKIISNGYEDLAYNDLGAGNHDPVKLIIGPNDHRRNQQLEKIENRIHRLKNRRSDKTQLVSDTFEAARLSRELECPRIETDGRFQRAINIAMKNGTYDQTLRAKYEFAWTTIWWHDDIEQLNQIYKDVEDFALQSDNAESLSKPRELLQILANLVFQGLETAEHLNLTARRERLNSKLFDLSQDKSRPNNALHAETLMVFNRLTDPKNLNNNKFCEEICCALDDIVDRAYGLAEFPVELIDKIVGRISSVVPESDALDNLVEKLAELLGQRQKEGKAGERYLARGKAKLKNEQPMEAVKWLGKASICFMKDEYKEQQFDTLYHLTVAYHCAGLLWAARSVCLSALVKTDIISSSSAEVKIEVIPTVVTLAWLSLELGRVSDLLHCLHLMHSMLHIIPITEDSKSNLIEEIQRIDNILSGFLTGIDDSFVVVVSKLPDILKTLGLSYSMLVLLYRLGHSNEIIEHGLIKEDSNIDDIAELVNTIASEYGSFDLPKSPRLNQGEDFFVKTKIIGVDIEFLGGSSIEDILLCEGLVTATEIFLATAFSNNIWPTIERLEIHIKISDKIDNPKFQFEPKTMALNVEWPKRFDVLDAVMVSRFGKHLLEFCSYIAVAMTVSKTKDTWEQMIANERLFDKTVSFSFAHFDQCRILGKHMTSFDDFPDITIKFYPPSYPLPKVIPHNANNKNPVLEKGEKIDKKKSNPYLFPKRHDDIVVSNIINSHLWNNAGWKGVMYGPSENSQCPPFLGLHFDNKEFATAIFKEWNDKFGERDTNDCIRISIVRGINPDNIHHYRIKISKSIEVDKKTIVPSQRIVGQSRINTMMPDSSIGLTSFLEEFEKFKVFYLIPCMSLKNNGEPKLLFEHAILCRNLHIRQVSEIGDNDQDRDVYSFDRIDLS